MRSVQSRTKKGGNAASDVKLYKIGQLAASLTSGTDTLFVQYPLSSLRSDQYGMTGGAISDFFRGPWSQQNSNSLGKSIESVGTVRSLQASGDVPPEASASAVVVTSVPQLPGQAGGVWRAYVKTYQGDFDEFEIIPGPSGSDVKPTGVTTRYMPSGQKQLMTI